MNNLSTENIRPVSPSLITSDKSKLPSNDDVSDLKGLDVSGHTITQEKTSAQALLLSSKCHTPSMIEEDSDDDEYGEMEIEQVAPKAPQAEPYKKLSSKEQKTLEQGGLLVTETKSKSSGWITSAPSTFTAYKLIEADGEMLAHGYWNPQNATDILPKCTRVQISDTLFSTTPNGLQPLQANYTFEVAVPSAIPLIGGTTFTDTIQLKNEWSQTADGGHQISFEQVGETSNVKQIKGAFTITPHEEKTLAAYEMSANFKGFIGSVLPSSELKAVAGLILQNIISLAK